MSSANENVVQFTSKPRTSRSCEGVLHPRPGDVVAFPQRSPAFKETSLFFAEQTEDPRQLIYYAGSQPNPFLQASSGDWSLVPVIPNNPDLIVLRATYRRFGPPLTSSRMTLRDARIHYVIHDFTRFRLPPIYRVVRDLIESVRALETQLAGVYYEPIDLDLKALASSYPVHRRLEVIVNSWKVRSAHERRIQAALAEWIWRKHPERGDRAECVDLVQTISEEIRNAYGADPFVSLVLANLEEYLQ